MGFGIWDLNQMLYFFLFLSPAFTPECVLWIDRSPLVSDYYPPTCPLSRMLPWDYYNLRLVGEDGQILCEWTAANHLTELPCKPILKNDYRIEVWSNVIISRCPLWTKIPEYTDQDIAYQCPDWLKAYQNGALTIWGPWEINPPTPAAPACTLPRVNNSLPLATTNDYQFLAGRLSWWGVNISAADWQNRFDEQIRGAADIAGVPAVLLKGMLANESQFWPLWTGDAGEAGWMQLTWDGADTALRHDPDLFARYCQRAIWPLYCTGYDLLTPGQQYAVRSELLADLAVAGTPVSAAAQAADDLWIYAHILRAFACQAISIYPDRDVWQTASVLYNAGSACIKEDQICPQGKKYLEEVMK